MKWIDRAEARFGHLAIPGLIRAAAVFMILVYMVIRQKTLTFRGLQTSSKPLPIQHMKTM